MITKKQVAEFRKEMSFVPLPFKADGVTPTEPRKVSLDFAELIKTLEALWRVADATEIGLTISCDGKTRPCGVCDLRESLQALRGSK